MKNFSICVRGITCCPNNASRGKPLVVLCSLPTFTFLPLNFDGRHHLSKEVVSGGEIESRVRLDLMVVKNFSLFGNLNLHLTLTFLKQGDSIFFVL